MQETVSGFTVEGRWKDVVNSSKEVTKALEDTEVDSDRFASWDSWRPRKEERFSKELREKTVKEARVSRNAAMREGKTAGRDAEKAIEHATEAVTEVSRGDVEQATGYSREAFFRFARSLDTALRSSVRVIETVIYRHIVSRTNPQYFDSELISASVERKGRLRPGDEKRYVLDVTISDDTVREELSERLQAAAR